MKGTQRHIVGIMLWVLIIFAVGCTKGPMAKSSSSIKDQLKQFKGYEADVTVELLKNQQGNVLKMKQKAMADGTYKIILVEPEHLKGLITEYDGEKLTQYNPKTQMSTVCKEQEGRNVMLFTSFVERLKEGKSQESVEKLDGRDTKCFTVEIKGDYKYMAYEKVWFDLKSCKPIQLQVYGQDKEQTMQITYQSFKYY